MTPEAEAAKKALRDQGIAVAPLRNEAILYESVAAAVLLAWSKNTPVNHPEGELVDGTVLTPGFMRGDPTVSELATYAERLGLKINYVLTGRDGKSLTGIRFHKP